jgi:hypothetical protein
MSISTTARWFLAHLHKSFISGWKLQQCPFYEILISERSDIGAALFAGSRLISISPEKIEVFP